MPLRPIKRGQTWHAHGSVAGERVRQALGTRDKGQAEELCAALEARLWKRRLYGDEAVRTFEEAAESYVRSGGEARFVFPLARALRGRRLGEIKPGDIKKLARTLYPHGKPATLNRQVIVPARAIINHAAELGWCPHLRIEALPVVRAKRTTVDRDWIDRFIGQADADDLPHLSAAILFMYQTAARVSEAARLLPEHVDLGRRVALLERTKEGAWEARRLTHELVVRIANLPKVDGEPLFGYSSRFGIRNRMKAVCERAGLPWTPPHQAGRHSFASTALAKGASLREVMEAGGWKTARMVLEVYSHAQDAGNTVAALFDTEATQVNERAGQVTGGKGRNP